MASRIAELHRALFVMATTGVAISASRVASDAGDVVAWLFVAGSGLVLFGSDLLRSVEDAAVELSRTSDQPLPQARIDVFASSNPWRTVAVGLTGLLFITVATGAALF